MSRVVTPYYLNGRIGMEVREIGGKGLLANYKLSDSEVGFLINPFSIAKTKRQKVLRYAYRFMKAEEACIEKRGKISKIF